MAASPSATFSVSPQRCLGEVAPNPPVGASPPAEPRDPTGNSEPPSRGTMVLWVDDEVRPEDAAPRLLLAEGFHVRCVSTAGAGFAAATTARIDVIILDLNLPDSCGVSLLQQLRRAGVSTPVMVLTGYGDIQSAGAAMRLRASDFRQKPLVGDDLIAAVRDVVGTGPDMFTRPRGGQCRTSFKLSDPERFLTALVEEILTIGASSSKSPPELSRVFDILIRLLTNPEVEMPLFVGCANALRCMPPAVGRSFDAWLARTCREVRRALLVTPRRSVVCDAIKALKAAVEHGVRLSELELGVRLGVSGVHLGRLLAIETGLSFRVWRSALTVHQAACQLAATDEHVAQIGYRAGYAHPSQLNREFRQLLGMTPVEFRRAAWSTSPTSKEADAVPI